MVTFRLGLNDRSKPESWSALRSVSEINIHPNYNSRNYKNDIALFKLSVNKRFFLFVNLLLFIFFI